MPRCLVTGASGFVGGHLVDALVARGEDVRCLVRHGSDVWRLKSLGVALTHGDLLESDDLGQAVEGIDTVYHVAGVMHALDPFQQMRVNRDGVGRLLRICAQREAPPRVVLVSSIAASGPVLRGKVRREADSPQPVSEYGRSKLAGEREARKWSDKVPVTIVRPGIVFGPRDRGLLPIFRGISRLGIHLVPAWRPPRLSMIHATDLADLLVASASKGATIEGSGPSFSEERGCYFACVPEYPTYAELGTLIGSAVGRRLVLKLYFPGLMPWVVAAANERLSRWRGRSSPLRVDKIREAKSPSWACSCDAAMRDLDFAPAKSLVQRLTETAQWYRTQKLL